MRQRIIAGIILAFSLPATAASYLPLGVASGAFHSSGFGISADGTVAVGSSGSVPFFWTSATGLTSFGTAGSARAASADGSVVVGDNAPGWLWTQSGGVINLGDLAGGNVDSGANDVSDDGSIVVGQSWGTHGYEAFRWTAVTGMVGLGGIPGEDPGPGRHTSQAQAISGDGSTIVGSANTANGSEAFRWTASTGVLSLGALPVNYGGTASAVSYDGTIIAGAYGSSAAGWHFFRWTDATGMVSFADATAQGSRVSGMSADGSVIVGTTSSGGWVWQEAAGLQYLSQVLAVNGVEIAGWDLFSVNGISADGRWVVGSAFSPEGSMRAFVANITPVPIPAVGWLLGPAIGVLGWIRRKAVIPAQTYALSVR